MTAGYRRASSSHRDQCVVAVSPSSRPAWASAKAPEQIDTIRAPRPAAARSSPRVIWSRVVPAAPAQPGTTTVWAERSRPASPSGSTRVPPATGTGPPSTVAVLTS